MSGPSPRTQTTDWTDPLPGLGGGVRQGAAGCYGPAAECALMAGLNATCPPPPYEQARAPLVVLYSLVFVVGFPANLLTLWFTYSRQVRRNNVLGVYLCSLSACDLVYLCTLPLWTHYIRLDHRWPWGALSCQVTGFVFYTNMYVSVLLLCCVSCDRYVAVRYALESRGLRRQRVAAGITAAVVAAVMAAHVPVFVIREGDPDRENSSLSCFEPDHAPSRTVTAFNYARFCLGFAVPLALLTASNRGVLREVSASHSLQAGQKRRVRWLAVAVVTLFLVCFAPYHLVLLVRAVFSHFPRSAECAFARRIFVPYSASLALCTLSSACNPLLYVLSSGDAREELTLALRGQSEELTLALRGQSEELTLTLRGQSEEPAGGRRGADTSRGATKGWSGVP